MNAKERDEYRKKRESYKHEPDKLYILDQRYIKELEHNTPLSRLKRGECPLCGSWLQFDQFDPVDEQVEFSELHCGNCRVGFKMDGNVQENAMYSELFKRLESKEKKGN